MTCTSLITFIHQILNLSRKLSSMPKRPRLSRRNLLGTNTFPAQMLPHPALILLQPLITTNTSPLFPNQQRLIFLGQTLQIPYNRLQFALHYIDRLAHIIQICTRVFCQSQYL